MMFGVKWKSGKWAFVTGLFAMAATAEAASLQLSPGEIVTLNPNTTTTVSCSGSGDFPPPINQQCKTFYPLKGDTGTIFSRINHAGYSDDGTLKWPDGSIFLRRHAGYSDDFTILYPGNKVLFLRHNGYSDDGTLYWSNGQTMLRQHSGYSDHGTILRPDGTTWLLRHAGYSDDLSRFGLPLEQFEDSAFSTRARLTDANSVSSVIKHVTSTYSITITIEPYAPNVAGSTDFLKVEECYEF
jgi:hypothetical protein